MFFSFVLAVLHFSFIFFCWVSNFIAQLIIKLSVVSLDLLVSIKSKRRVKYRIEKKDMENITSRKLDCFPKALPN